MDFPGGTVNKNPPANAGDVGSVLSLGRFHVPRDNSARGPALQGPCSAVKLRSEKPVHCWEGQSPLTTTRESPGSTENPAPPPVTLKDGGQNVETCGIVLQVLFMNTLNNKI